MIILLITSEKTLVRATEKANAINTAFQFARCLFRKGVCIGYKFILK